MNCSDIAPPRDTAKAALEKWRFTLKIRNKYVHMMYAVNMNMKNAKAKVFERPGCYKQFIVVKVLTLTSITMIFATFVCSSSRITSNAVLLLHGRFSRRVQFNDSACLSRHSTHRHCET
jgi:hypothetical protein